MSGKGQDFDGVYLLKENLPQDKPHELCADNCIYTKLEEPEEDFCFQQVEVSEGANVVCGAENITSTIQPTTINVETQVENLNNSISEKSSKKTELVHSIQVNSTINEKKELIEPNQSISANLLDKVSSHFKLP